MVNPLALYAARTDLLAHLGCIAIVITVTGVLVGYESYSMLHVAFPFSTGSTYSDKHDTFQLHKRLHPCTGLSTIHCDKHQTTDKQRPGAQPV